MNPRANGSAEATLPVGTALIVDSQSAKPHDFLGSILSSPPRPNPSSDSPGVFPVYSRGISENLLNMGVCEADSRAAGHIFAISGEIQKFIAVIHYSPPMDPIPSQLNPVLILPPCSFKINFNVTPPFTFTSPRWSLYL